LPCSQQFRYPEFRHRGTVFSIECMKKKPVIIGTIAVFAAIILTGLHSYTSRYDEIINRAASRNRVDFFLVKSLIYEESWFRPDIRGSAGEIGLMQITKAAAADFLGQRGFPPFREDRLFEPALNLEIGCWYLRKSLDHYKNSPQPALYALLRYNAGEARADNWLRLGRQVPSTAGVEPETRMLSVVDFPKTRAYVRRILQRSRSHNFWF
jgi:soluble lytic murein transglycosylase